MPARWAEAIALVLLSWTVAVPLTTWFARVRWTAREPIAALIAWQAIGLSGGLALLTAELTAAASGSSGPWRSAVSTSLTHPGSVDTLATVALIIFGLSLLWLVGVLIASFVGATRSRRAHRDLVELLARPETTLRSRFEVIETDVPVAYSLPGRTPHVVLSRAAVAALTDEELQAVLGHERAHLRQRHNLLVQPFIAWQHSLPFLQSPLAARLRVEQLVEMVCDDSACRSVSPAVLTSALETLDPTRTHIAERVERLTAARGLPVVRVAILCGAVALVALPPTVLLALPR